MGRVVKRGGFVVLWDHNPANPYWPILMKRVPRTPATSAWCRWPSCWATRAPPGCRRTASSAAALRPTFCPPPLAGVWSWVERAVEVTPGLNVLAAHNVVVARKAVTRAGARCSARRCVAGAAGRPPAARHARLHGAAARTARCRRHHPLRLLDATGHAGRHPVGVRRHLAETYAVYPPVTLYAYQVVGTAYRWLQDPTSIPTAAQQSLWLREGIKFVALAWHLLTGAGHFRAGAPLAATQARRGRRRRCTSLNPAALYDVAHWAQPDGAHSLFSVLAIGLLGSVRSSPPGPPWRSRRWPSRRRGRPVRCWSSPRFACTARRGLVRGAVAGAVAQPGRSSCRLWSPADWPSC